MPNIKRYQSELTLKGCNCSGGVQSCRLGGHCLIKSLIYEGEVKYPIHNPSTGIDKN